MNEDKEWRQQQQQQIEAQQQQEKQEQQQQQQKNGSSNERLGDEEEEEEDGDSQSIGSDSLSLGAALGAIVNKGTNKGQASINSLPPLEEAGYSSTLGAAGSGDGDADSVMTEITDATAGSVYRQLQEHHPQSLLKKNSSKPIHDDLVPSLDHEVQFITNKEFDTVFANTGEQLGEATFSTVFIGIHKKSKRQYAIKHMNVNEMSATMNSMMMNGKRNFLQEEIDNLITVRGGPNIVPLYEVFQYGPDYYLIMEYVKGGELFDVIINREEFTELEAYSYCIGLLRALQYIHSKRIVHRDIKPENILLVSPPPAAENDGYNNDDDDYITMPVDADISVKVCDFGFSKKVLMENGCRTLCGTPGYMAPEILERWPSYDVPCDVWSVGVILFLLLGGYLPFEDEEEQDEDLVFERTRNGQYYFYPEYWCDISKEAKDFVTMMLTINPKKRITAEDALEHIWIRSIEAFILRKKNADADADANASTATASNENNNVSQEQELSQKYSSKVKRSVSRAMSRNVSRNIPRNVSRKMSRNISRNVSRNVSKPFLKSANSNRLTQLSQDFAGYLERKGKEPTKQGKSNIVQDIPLIGEGGQVMWGNGSNSLSALRNTIVPDSETGKPFSHFYNIGDLLGEGGYASVYRATHNEFPEQACAVKIVNLKRFHEEEETKGGAPAAGPKLQDSSLQDEIWALKVLRGGPHIVRLFDVFEESENVYIVMEEMKGGDLLNRISDKEVYTEREARKTCKIIFEAMDYIHKKKIAHRDIKPENVLLVEDGDDTTIKIADFGFAKKVPRQNCLRTLCGTAQYVAPEVLELKGTGYDHRADMWGVGVVTYILLGGYAPFEGPVDELAQSIIHGAYEFHEEYWSEISRDAKLLIRSLLSPVDIRLSAEQALQCQWMTLEEETLNIKDLSRAVEAIKSNKASIKQVTKIMSKRGSLSEEFTKGMSSFMDIKKRQNIKSNMNLGDEMLRVLDEDSLLHEDSSSGKPFETLYKWGKVLGEGNFSIIQVAAHRRSNIDYAVKRVTRKDLDPSDAVALHDEISALHAVAQCDQIVSLHDVFEEPDYTYLVMEYMGGGDLITRITHKESYTESDARAVVKQLLIGVDYCHKKRIAHRKLNPENILLVDFESDVDIKISDFEFAKKVAFPNALRTQCGTEGYVAPEVLEHRPAYDVQCDMWTIGVVLYILLGGYRPFRGETHEVMRQIRYGEYKFHKRYWKHISEEAKWLIKRMLTVNPSLRITATLSLQSDWLNMEQEDLDQNNLDENKEQLKKEFREQAKAKLRAAVHAITAMKKLQSLGNHFRAFQDF